EWFEKNKNNELVLIQNPRAFNFTEIIVPIIEKYNADTTNTNVYVVSAKITQKKLIRLNTMTLAKYANEIIKKCVIKNQNYEQEKYGLIWECSKIEKDGDYKKLTRQINNADMLYVDGFCDSYDSYEEFISHYLYNYELILTDMLKYQVVINLQKINDNNTTYMDIENISRHMCINDLSYVEIEFVKFRNSLGDAILAAIQHDDGDRLCVIGDCYTVTKIDDNIDIEITEYTSKGLIPVFKYTQKIVREQYKIGMLENLNNIKQTRFDKLDLKIINFDAIKMCPRRFGFYELSFTTFVNEKKQEIKIIPDKNKNQSESMLVDYEAIIIVQISTMRDTFHYITRYPVLDADGQYPITNYDTEDNYYQGLRLQHDKLQIMLDTIYDIYLNDCIIDDQKSIMLNLLLDIDEKHSLGYYKMTHEIELEDTNVPCHQQNIEFIKNLQSNVGENINIQLYNVERDKKFSIELIRYKTYCDFIDLYSYKNKMDIDTYLKEKDYNANRGVLMILNIKNTKEEDSTYYFINHKYTNNEIRIRLIKYISENNESAFTELKTRTLKHLKNIFEKKNGIDNDPNTKGLYKHLKNMVSVIIKHIENDYYNFLLKYVS
ncbi:hypothetical protein BDAP_001535, partial [Binucleata daphniae]